MNIGKKETSRGIIVGGYFIRRVEKYFFKIERVFQKRGEKYGFFGGGVDGEETFLQACIREIKEELNLDIESNDLIEAAKFTKTITGVGHCENRIFISPWRDEYEKDLQILEGDAGVWMTLDQAKQEVFFNHDYMVFDLLEKYFENINNLKKLGDI